MTINNFVSIIVPTKNSEKTLKNCLSSIQNQNYPHFECIVVDNMSTDNTQKIAHTYANQVFIKGPERCQQRNYGAQKAKGNYLLFIDSDMELHPNIVSSCVKEIRKSDNVGVVIPEISFGNTFWAQCKKLEKEFYNNSDAIEAARFFPKEIFNKVNGYDEKLVSTEDWDLSKRISEHGHITRIHESILHNEGDISIRKTFQKKFYYGKKLTKQKQKEYKKELSVFHRIGLFLRKPNLIIKHPIRFMGMVVMKSCEYSAFKCGQILSSSSNESKTI